MEVNIQYYDSPCGAMILGSVGGELCLCDWYAMPCARRNMRRLERLLNAEFIEMTSPVLERAKTELDEYFAGERRLFDIPLRPVGTSFQMLVWKALLEIPYGKTRTYKEIAEKVGNVRGVRAAAQAVGANGISVFIPCHRVIGSDGSLTGFAGGLSAKKSLLELELSDICVSSVYNTYCACSKTGDYFLTTKQKEIFASLIKPIEDKAEAERLEKEKKAEAERLAAKRKSTMNSIDLALKKIKNLKTEGDMTYYFSLMDYNFKKTFYSKDGSTAGGAGIKKYIEDYLPLSDYQIESLSENLDEATLILTTSEKKQSKGFFASAFGKEKVAKYRVVVGIKDETMCIEDFDVSKATHLNE